MAHSPRKACSFSMSSWILRSDMHHGCMKDPRAGATCSGHIRPRRPIVMVVFSLRLLLRRSSDSMGIRCCATRGTSGTSACGDIFTAISPTAQHALLDADMFSGLHRTSGARFFCANTKSSEHARWDAQILDRSPTSSKAPWRTSACGSAQSTSSISRVLEEATRDSTEVPRPSTSTHIKSRAHSTNSFSTSTPFTFICSCCWMRLTDLR
mmetsp:Transcript_39441/g.85848  ORF Transcript_39441/g.85848 Transcript_39441/m.85848 type:complete len:210 (-) Transcript_39441:816-1445(-)